MNERTVIRGVAGIVALSGGCMLVDAAGRSIDPANLDALGRVISEGGRAQIAPARVESGPRQSIFEQSVQGNTPGEPQQMRSREECATLSAGDWPLRVIKDRLGVPGQIDAGPYTHKANNGRIRILNHWNEFGTVHPGDEICIGKRGDIYDKRFTGPQNKALQARSNLQTLPQIRSKQSRSRA